MKNTETIALSLPVEMVRKLKSKAAELHIPVSTLARLLLAGLMED